MKPRPLTDQLCAIVVDGLTIGGAVLMGESGWELHVEGRPRSLPCNGAVERLLESGQLAIERGGGPPQRGSRAVLAKGSATSAADLLGLVRELATRLKVHHERVVKIVATADWTEYKADRALLARAEAATGSRIP